MESQGRGDAGGIDPADQWVFNPETGTYELRLPGARRPDPSEHAAPRPRHVPSPRRGDPHGDPPGGPTTRGTGSGDAPRPEARPPRGRRKAKPKRSRLRKGLVWTGGGLAFLLVVGAGAAWYAYQRLNGNITKVDTGFDNGFSHDEAVNILLIGTDTRTGDGNDSYGGDASEGNDTTILVHFSKNREHATALSIPRDLITDIPECEVTHEDGTQETVPASYGVRFNQSMGALGRDPGCVWRTVQELTGVEINHFMMADFNAVKDLSTAVGGVPVCVSEPIHDEKSGLDLEPGRHELQGEDALAFVRTRHGVGNGSDLDRIHLQQQFLASMAREITGGDMLSSLTDFWDLADTATKALTVDTGIGSIEKLYDLASDVGRIPMSDVNFVTLPVRDNPDEPADRRATVVVDEDRAEPIFRMLREDIDPDAAEETEEEEPGAGGDSAGAGSAAPEDVRVDIYNGGDVIGAAQDTLQWLQVDEGMPLASNRGNAPESQETTTLEYRADQAAQAATLAEIMGLPDSALKEQPGDSAEGEAMVLVLGNDFRGAGEPIEVPAEIPDDVTSIQADDEDVCAE
ncbi:LCP family protein [Streptomyces sp. RFCAC02]|uniref:LCP family protein n=1 Tax=Streptomyces sp. RFCAC02 TaxID=2499143 RepID=UPI00102209EB|nr:LCP family protein [Streptomyces sp. RFCAC02]